MRLPCAAGLLVWPAMSAVPLVLARLDCHWVASAEACAAARLPDGPLPRPAGGLLLGLFAVAVAQVFAVTYHALHRHGVFGDAEAVQTDPPSGGGFWAGLQRHLLQPGGVILLATYLSATWLLDLMPESYYSFQGGIQWHLVAAQLLVQDALQAGMHMTEHCIPSLYRFAHKAHHRFVSPCFFDAFSGSCADTITMILIPLYATACIVPANVWSYMTFGAVYSGWLMMLHSEHRHLWEGLFERVWLGTAADHHVHHYAFNYNFGHLWMGWDRAAGTYRPPSRYFTRKLQPEAPPGRVPPPVRPGDAGPRARG